MAWIFFVALIVIGTIACLIIDNTYDRIRENQKRIERMDAETKMYDVRNRRS